MTPGGEPVTPARPRTRRADGVRTTKWILERSHTKSPGRGKAIKPKRSSLNHDAWTLRNEECLGHTLVARTEKQDGDADFKSIRMRCSLCSKQTNMNCIG
jgi:hypothetical protein